jgi:hypothetical protein
MRSYGGICERIVSEENLHGVWRRVRCGHAASAAVREFEANLEVNLADLRMKLMGNNNGFRLVSTMSEQTGFHFATPALRGRGDEHAQLRSASSAGDRHAGTFWIGETGI